MLGNTTRFAGKLVAELLMALPLSLITKLADGKLDREELQGLIREITVLLQRWWLQNTKICQMIRT